MPIPIVIALARRTAHLVVRLAVLPALALAAPVVVAQQAATPATTLPLDDLRSFRPTAGNWQIVGGFAADRNADHAYTTTPGTGILANIQTESARDNLFTTWEHADIELDIEVMMPRGSNSGVYLQGRYEIQLLDSWGVTEPQASDIGGIYERWDEARPEGQKGYEGHAPPINVARAPGLWQHLNIVFRAPRFDAAGLKTRNAAFVRVALNGVVLHENVELTGPTRASAWDDEAARAPLMIQGDHGPVAFRNIAYRLYGPEQVTVSNLRYGYYQGSFDWQMPDLADLTLTHEGAAPAIDASLADTEKRFALQFTGTLDIPTTGDYVLDVAHSARVRLDIDGKTVLTDRDNNTAAPGDFALRTTRLRLTKGAHPFALTYAKGNWHSVPTALGFYIAGPGLLRTELSAAGSLPADAFAAYDVAPAGEAWIQRNFVMHRGTPRTHAMSVGEPSGIHYAFDMGNGALLSLWKGRFVNASTMWYQRGDLQSALPLGSLVELAGWPTIAHLSDDAAPWPTLPDGFRFKGYSLNEAERPVFAYQVGETDVLDQLTPEGAYFSRRIALSGSAPSGKAWVFIAEGERIELMPSGAYAVDNHTYYIENLQGGLAFVRNVGDKSELLMSVDVAGGALVSYDIVW